MLHLHACLFCKNRSHEGVDLCSDCLAQLPFIRDELNPRPLALNPAITSFSLFHYEPPIDKLLTALKFNQKLLVANLFGCLLARAQKNLLVDCTLPDGIIPVPLHATRLKVRGYNQALEICRPLQRQLGIPLIKRGVLRHRATNAQAQLPAKARKQNVAKAFSCTLDLTDKKLVIVDDILTTGHTITALANVLLRAGAQSISVWTLAKTGL